MAFFMVDEFEKGIFLYKDHFKTFPNKYSTTLSGVLDVEKISYFGKVLLLHLSVGPLSFHTQVE